MTEQVKSQILGLGLAFATAIGCIFFEKLSKNFSKLTFMIIKITESLILCAIAATFFSKNIQSEYTLMTSSIKYPLYVVGYIATGVTTILWFTISKNQDVMVSSIYEVKYIIMLAVIYILFGEEKFTVNTLLGVVLALCSIYFISKKAA